MILCFWHPALIPYMPDKTLKRLFRTCCELRENWRGEKSTKQAPFFVRQGVYEQLIAYQQIVIHEMQNRGLDWEPVWDDIEYMGENRPFNCLREDWLALYVDTETPYGYMNDSYLRNQVLWLRNHGKGLNTETLEALRQKGFKGLEKLL